LERQEKNRILFFLGAKKILTEKSKRAWPENALDAPSSKHCAELTALVRASIFLPFGNCGRINSRAKE
jgi:hypothetical protein